MNLEKLLCLYSFIRTYLRFYLLVCMIFSFSFVAYYSYIEKESFTISLLLILFHLFNATYTFLLYMRLSTGVPFRYPFKTFTLVPILLLFPIFLDHMSHSTSEHMTMWLIATFSAFLVIILVCYMIKRLLVKVIKYKLEEYS
ncbi:hypothetical protein PTI45_03982 [Paenibacillus nuruki]|uniref:Uncharacterized protein n=1 Tax=Paenibacillus nuruki TaxID=1886670 RepID=A0A1E3KYV0_9BACL|nr:hypothetical protein PTI45_03982 [Paenibacillus nuruki]